MSVAKHIVSTLLIGHVVFWANLVDGYFLTSSHSELALSKHEVQANSTGLQDPSQDDGDATKGHAAKPKEARVADDKKGEDYTPKTEKVLEVREKAVEVKTAASKYKFIDGCHKLLAKIFAKTSVEWYQDWKLWVGSIFYILVWAKWLKYGYDEIYWQRALHCFGINIVILHHLQYAATFKTGMVGVCLLLAGQAIVQSLLFAKNRDFEDVPEDFTCETLYLDLSLPIEQILVLFLAQVAVWWFYLTSILHNFDFNHVNYLFWLVAYMTMQMTMIFNRGEDSVLGQPFPCHEVYHVLSHAGKVRARLQQDGKLPFKIEKVDFFSRAVMGFWVNGVCREILAYTIPLMLMGFEQPMDFVVYCVGVNFICTVDDMATKVFELLLTHHLKVGDKVVARHPANKPKRRLSVMTMAQVDDPNLDNPWLAGVVTEVDNERHTCRIRFLDESCEESEVAEKDVYYAPNRDDQWGQGELRGNDLIPDDACPVTYREPVGCDVESSASSKSGA